MFVHQVLVFLVSVVYLGESVSPVTVSQTRLENHIRSAFKSVRHHSKPAEKEKARNYIYQFFRDLPCKNAVIFNISSRYTDTLGVNMVYTLPGPNWNTSEDSALLLGSHYDTEPDTPGVDDNGSGMAALLEAMHVLTATACQRHRTLMFVAFDFEEEGLVGSRDVAKALKSLLGKQKSRFEGAVILETILQYNTTPGSQVLPTGMDKAFPRAANLLRLNQYRGNFLLSTGRVLDLGLSNAFYNTYNGSQPPGIMLVNLTIPNNPLPQDLLRSDHASFWNEDLKAIFLTDTAEFRGYMRSCYHKQCDDTSHLTPENLRFLTKTTEALVKMFHPDPVVPAPSDGTSTFLASLWMTMSFSIAACINEL